MIFINSECCTEGKLLTQWVKNLNHWVTSFCRWVAFMLPCCSVKRCFRTFWLAQLPYMYSYLPIWQHPANQIWDPTFSSQSALRIDRTSDWLISLTAVWLFHPWIDWASACTNRCLYATAETRPGILWVANP